MRGAAAAALAALPGAAVGCGSCQHNGPNSQAEQPAWLQALEADRNSTLAKLKWAGGVFDVPELKWTQTSYMQPQMHPYDRFFYDPDLGNYTVKKWLKDLDDRYGGIDSALIWPTYTNIGADDRNQFDLFRALPGGLDGVRQFTAELHASGVKVLWPYNPWDHGTRREPLSDEDTFAVLLKQTGGDGFNGDTMGSVPQSFWDAALKADYPLAFEPEGGGSDAALNWSTMGWGYWSYPTIPVVDRQKFITRGKFMTNVCDRWNKDKTNNLQMAFFNGAGYETWENVWGTWNGITPRDGEAIRRVATMLRYFGKAGFLQSELWEPHVPITLQPGVFASKWPLPSQDATMYTVVNRGGQNLTGPQMIVVPEDAKERHYYDCYHGVELHPAPLPPQPPPTPAPTVPPAPDGYYEFPGSNSYSGHGGTDIDTDPVAGLSIAQCGARCDGDAACSCITYQADGGNCWKRSGCEPLGFAQDAAYAVFLKKAQYVRYAGKNCFDGAGGNSITNNTGMLGDSPWLTGVTVAQCTALCDAHQDRKCGCVTYEPNKGECYMRSDCVPTLFGGGGFDVYVNEAMQPAPLGPAPPPPPLPADAVQLTFDIEEGGFGCVIEQGPAAAGPLAELLSTMKGLTARPLSSYSSTWTYEMQTMVPIEKTAPAASAPAGMVKVPKGDFSYADNGIEIEGDDGHGVDIQYPWEDHPQKEHKNDMELGPFFIDRFPVTTTNYSAYLKKTGFTPKDPYNWLKNWNGSRVPPPALADVPVTYVSLKEARAYCAWAGGRLPHSYEWQYAAQGTDGRKYPWGSDNTQANYPKLNSGNTFPGPEPVGKYSPAGDSPFGVADLVGNVWQYTTEFRDSHTRGVVTRGGSNYRPSGSGWYYPNQPTLDTHNKYFLMDDRYERCGTIGFRCVVDAA